MVEAVMARPKRSGKTPKPQDAAGKTIGVRVDSAYAEWLDRLARFNRSSIAVLFDQAMANYAKEIGFAEEPPER